MYIYRLEYLYVQTGLPRRAAISRRGRPWGAGHPGGLMNEAWGGRHRINPDLVATTLELTPASALPFRLNRHNLFLKYFPPSDLGQVHL